jgi:antitoxin component YwqK of YwqJK toxin-antitoxin module
LALSFSCLGLQADEPARLPVAGAVRAVATDEAVEAGAVGEGTVEGGATASVASDVEIITERYPNGAVASRREVCQDAQGNFVNHGGYEAYDQSGNVVMSGQYDMGRASGTWSRSFRAIEGEVMAEIDKTFRGPYVSSARFKDGQLDGPWTIVSGSNQKIIEWQFQEGRPTGIWTWYYTNGRKRKEVGFNAQGDRHGIATDYAADGKMVREIEYVDGRYYFVKATDYKPGQKKSEGRYISARDTAVVTYDWRTNKIKRDVLAKPGPALKDGPWSWWYINGQLQMAGQFKEGIPVGKFTWWYQNAQKQAEGEYIDGQMHGLWITWHQNGLKQSQGEYENGTPVGRWQQWNADGRVAESQEYHDATTERPIETAEQQEGSWSETLRGQAGAPDPSAVEPRRVDQQPQLARPPQEGTIRRARIPNGRSGASR